MKQEWSFLGINLLSPSHIVIFTLHSESNAWQRENWAWILTRNHWATEPFTWSEGTTHRRSFIYLLNIFSSQSDISTTVLEKYCQERVTSTAPETWLSWKGITAAIFRHPSLNYTIQQLGIDSFMLIQITTYSNFNIFCFVSLFVCLFLLPWFVLDSRYLCSVHLFSCEIKSQL